MKKYTRRQITEAIAYWKKQLNEANGQSPYLAGQYYDVIVNQNGDGTKFIVVGIIDDEYAQTGSSAGDVELLQTEFKEVADICAAALKSRYIGRN